MAAVNEAQQQTAEGDARVERALIDRWIEENPHYPGKADARLRDYGVSIWALIGHARAVNGGCTEVARDYDLPKEAVEAVFAFYRRHAAIIDDRLAANVA